MTEPFTWSTCQSCGMAFGLELKERVVEGPVHMQVGAPFFTRNGNYTLCTLCEKFIAEEIANPQKILALLTNIDFTAGKLLMLREEECSLKARIARVKNDLSNLRAAKYDFAIFHLQKGRGVQRDEKVEKINE